VNRRIPFLLLISFFLLAANINVLSFGEDAEEDKREIQIINLESTNLEYSLGYIQKDAVTKKTIKIRNKLEEEIEIVDVRATCDCINIVIEPETIERNGIFEAEIIFDSTGLAQEAEEVVYILTKSMKYELIRLVVIGEIR